MAPWSTHRVACLFVLLVDHILGDLLQAPSHPKAKGQIYYLCGVFPDQYYSTEPCYFTETKCANGGEMLRIGCTHNRQCAQYSRGATACISDYCCTVPNNVTAPPSRPFGSGYCYNGQLSQVRCNSQGQCSRRQKCMNGLCCSTTGREHKYACGGVSAISDCTAGKCDEGAYCTPSNQCCECPWGRSGGRCNQGMCPDGFTCMRNGHCCASCPNGVAPFGACRNGVCGGGSSCTAGNICC